MSIDIQGNKNEFYDVKYAVFHDFIRVEPIGKQSEYSKRIGRQKEGGKRLKQRLSPPFKLQPEKLYQALVYGNLTQ